MSLNFQMVSGRDLSVFVTLPNYTSDLADATEIEIILTPAECPTYDAAVVTKKKTLAEITVVEDNQIKFDLTHDDTEDLEGDYILDGFLTTADGKKYPIRNKSLSPGSVTILKNFI